MSRRLYISLSHTEPVANVLLYTIQFDRMPEYMIDDIFGIMEHGFLNPLLYQKVVRLKYTFHELEQYFNGSMTINIEPYWMGINSKNEQKLLDMKQPTIEFDLVDNNLFIKAYMNEVESLQRLRKAIL